MIKSLSTVLTVLYVCTIQLQYAAADQQPSQLKTQITVEMNYLLYLPTDYEKKESWPLILFLHGAGERGSDLNLVKVHGPPKLIEAGQSFPFIVVSPQCPVDQRWQPVTLAALMDDIVAKHKVDEQRIYVTGLSMGGFGTWALASYSPHRIAAIAPICGGGEKFWVKQFADVPVWVFHGVKDQVVPLARLTELVDELNKRKADVKFTEYADAEHDSWTASYENPELYQWMLKHKLSGLKVGVKLPEDRVSIRSHGSQSTMSVTSPHGIGGAMIDRDKSDWPDELKVRLRLHELESLTVSNGKAMLEMSVLSHGEYIRQLTPSIDGNPSSKIDQASDYWTDIKIVGTGGRGAQKIPLRAGFFEITIPKAMLKHNPKRLDFEWIDFHRN